MTNRYRIALAFVLAMSATAAWATGTLDQQFEVNSNDGSSSTSSIRNQTSLESAAAQTFTVGADGILQCVEVYVARISSLGGPLILEIQSVTAGVPDGNVLASVSRAPDTIPYFQPTFVAFDLTAANLGVTTGDVLAIVLRADLLPINDSQWYDWEGENGGNATYAGGQWFARVDFGAWTNYGSSRDFGFRTYVGAPVANENATWSEIKNLYR